MAEMKIHRMTADEFLDWSTRQEDRYELVDGLPRMMTGARARHDRIVVSTLTMLKLALRGGSCEPFSSDIAVRIPAGNVRRPDILVDCGGGSDDRTSADTPVLVVEVLSPSTREIDSLRKVVEYQSVPSIQHILLIEPEDPAAILHSRLEQGGWTMLALIGLDTAVPLTALGISPLLRAFYEGPT